MKPNPSNQLSDSAAVSNLTIREKEILTLVASGYINEAIADALCISPHTVENHVKNIYRKTKVNNRLQAILWAAKYL